MPFKILDLLFVFFRGCHRTESTEVPMLFCFPVYFPGVKPVFP